MIDRRPPMSPSSPWAGAVEIAADGARLEGELRIPDRARGLVLFSHGSGSSRHSPRNRRVAELLQHAGFGTLLFDLLTRDEERSERFTGHLRFDIPLLASRLENATRWAMADARTASFPLGYFGASTGAAAALIAAAVPDLAIHAVVSRGGRPDLAADALERVRAPTLLIVGGADDAVIPLNQSAYARLRTTKRLELVRGATHLFEEPGALERVAMLATRWFQHYLIFA